VSNKDPENEQVSQNLPEENIQYEVDEPIILLDRRGKINQFVILNLMIVFNFII